MQKSKPRITVYHHTFLPLSETFIYRQCQGLKEYFDLKLLTPSTKNTAEFPGIKPLVIPPRNKWRVFTGQEKRIFKKHLQGSNLFHVNFGHIALEMQRHASQLGIPMTAYFLGIDASAYLRDPEYCKKLKQSIFEAVFVNSEDMKRRLTPFLPDTMKCNVAYCGIPLERFPFRRRHSVPKGAIFLQVGRFEPKKGIDVTLKAFSIYQKETDPKARLLIAGDGPMKSELLQLAGSLGLNQSVSFLGYIGYKKYIELLQNVDVFMHPSVTSKSGDMEGLPTAICEAMACGLPIISTRHSGIPEIIDDGENGFLAEERDIEGIYRQMVALRTADIGTISKNARTKIEKKFDHNNTIIILSEYMNRIITGGGIREL